MRELTRPNVDTESDLSGATSRAGGLARSSYLTVRAKEEIYRAGRYGRPLGLLYIRVSESDEASTASLETWLQSNLRASDIPACLGSSDYAILMPEADERDAAGLQKRLLAQFVGVEVKSVHFPADGNSWDALLTCARRGVENDPQQVQAQHR